jgi:serine/threonine protein phosphatase PrpC
MDKYKIEAGTGQHIGNREEQQDCAALFAAPNAPGYMLAVLADGMGGRSGGKMAAEQLIYTAKQLFDNFTPARHNLETFLRTIAQEAHQIIKLNGLSTKSEPHSTMVALILTPDGEAVWVHVGDSRLYRFSGKTFIDHTTDHSYVEKLINEGKLSPEAAKNHRHSNLLTNALGIKKDEPFITVGRQSGLKAGDAFLLCSDGLWHYFSDAELANVIAAKTPRQASEMLIEKAGERAAGNGDNCTMAIVKLVKPPKEDKGYTVEKLRRAI